MTEHNSPESGDMPEGPRARVSTMVRGLDAVLHGGLLPGRLYVLGGCAGTGKSVLASEIAFRRAIAGDTVVYFSAMTEPHATLVENAASFSFFDRALVGTRLRFASASQALGERGLERLIELVVRTVRESRASLLVFDSLSMLESFTTSPDELRRFTFDLASTASLLGCVILATVTRESKTAFESASIVADGMFELSRDTLGVRSIRTFQILKYRGSANLEGKHVFAIDANGVVIYPRLEGTVRVATEGTSDEAARLSLGVAELDRMLRGGVITASTTALFGAPGSGKTLLGMHFLEAGALRGEPGLYVGFYETPGRLVRKAEAVGIELGKHLSSGVLEIQWRAATEQLLDQFASELIENVRRRGVRRVVIDGVDALLVTAMYQGRVSRFLAALTHDLRALGVTALFTQEMRLLMVEVAESLPALSAMFDNVVLLRYVEIRNELDRQLSILKTRESDCDAGIREFRITESGIVVAARSAGPVAGEGTPGGPAGAAKKRKPRGRR